ncbi:MAG: inositol 2-dehydrogenase [Fidelibacterota bacterium]|nr:MAG: inositol 2-dehydrogenase [Candidatus Neomarinimicrobiota bacterium]
MNKKKIVAGLIGAGRIGKMHAHNIITYLPDVFLKAVADCKPDKPWVDSLGIPVCADHCGQILDDPDIEAVVITTPSATHVEMITLAAMAGKQIFCEKPIAFEADNVAQATSAANEAGVMLQVGFNRRFDPDFRAVQEAVTAGKVGTPHIIRITNRDPIRPSLDFIPDSGGLFMDFSIHDFDMVRFLSGSEVVQVYAAGSVLIDPEIERLGDIDTALITLRLASGTLCIIDLSRETGYGYDQQVEVFGSKGSISAFNTTPTRTVLSTDEGVYSDKPHYSFVERYEAAFVEEMRAFFACVRNGSSPLVSGEDAQMAVKIAQAALESYQQNRPVEVA